MNLEQIDTSTTAGKAEDSYELSLAASLRQLAEAKWTLSGEPMPEDARQVLLNAAGMLAFNCHHIEAGLATIHLQSEFIEAMSNEMRAAITPADGYVLVPVEPTENMLQAGYPRNERIDDTFDRLGAWADMLAARPEVS